MPAESRGQQGTPTQPGEQVLDDTAQARLGGRPPLGVGGGHDWAQGGEHAWLLDSGSGADPARSAPPKVRATPLTTSAVRTIVARRSGRSQQGGLPRRGAPASKYVGEPNRLTGSLQLSDGSAGSQQPLEVVRAMNGTSTALPTVTTRSDGTFVFDDTPSATGTAQ